MVCLPVFRKLGSKSTAAGVGCHWPVDVEVVTSLTCCPCWASDCQHTSTRSEEHTSELQSQSNLVCRLLLEKKKKNYSAWTSLCKSLMAVCSSPSPATETTH